MGRYISMANDIKVGQKVYLIDRYAILQRIEEEYYGNSNKKYNTYYLNYFDNRGVVREYVANEALMKELINQ